MANEVNVTPETESKDVPKTYTEEDARNIYAEGQKVGYSAAVKQMRSDINDYLNDLLINIKGQ
jgi:hypothetical protein